MIKIATIERFGRWGTSVFSENTIIFIFLLLWQETLINGESQWSVKMQFPTIKLIMYIPKTQFTVIPIVMPLYVVMFCL